MELAKAKVQGKPSKIDSDERMETLDGAVIENEKKSAENESFCPLFMEGLPSDFGSNPELAALASLLEDSDGESDAKRVTDDSTTAPRIWASTNKGTCGGGKLKSTTRGSRRHHSSTTPYPQPSNRKAAKSKTATMGEAQLFLKMWKI